MIPERERLLRARESVVRERHHWVRLTQRCNNRCVFCLDAHSQSDAPVSSDAIRDAIARGRRDGATKLILSGGEASIHPGFFDILREGRRLGYRKIQVISNGRMFSYPRFLERACRAGLSELTLSIHGPDAELHDDLVGVPGAFAQVMTALRAALGQGRLVVNVDVCVNSRNVTRLPELLEQLIAVGVREFDLLYLIPFGRAHDHWRALAMHPEQAWPGLRYAFDLARRPDLHIWFNRFPPELLEGHEHLIQDPWKLHDEVRGREAELLAFATRGEPLFCFDADRCAACYLAGYCTALARMRAALLSGDAALRIDAAGASSAPRLKVPQRVTWIRGEDVDAVREAVRDQPGRELILELESYAALELEAKDVLSGKRVVRAHASHSGALEDLLAAREKGSGFEIVLRLDRATAGALERGAIQPVPGLVLAPMRHLTSTDSAEMDPDFEAALRHAPPEVSVEGLPRCLAGRPPRPLAPAIDATSLSPAGLLDPLGFVQQYIRDFAGVKSLRCRGCPHDSECAGVSISYVRAHGLARLRPMALEDRAVVRATSRAHP